MNMAAHVGSARRMPTVRPRRPSLSLFLIWIVLIASLVSWRRGVIYQGNLDPVVLAKAFVSLLALAAAALLAFRSPLTRRIGAGPVYTVLFIGAISTLGAFTGNTVSAAAVLSVRIVIVVVTLLFIVRACDSATIVITLLTAMGAVGIFAASTGFHLYLEGKRLQGDIPPLQPNELATLVIAPFVGVVFSLVHHRIAVWNVLATLILGAIIFATGSRTGLGVALLSVVIVLVLAPRISRPLAVTLILIIPVVYAVVTLTGVIQKLALRGASTSSLLTLNSRTNAWDVVLNIPSNSWQRWIGSGLDVKTVAVVGQYWNRQVLDSSWISSLAQSGIVGTVALAGLVLVVLLRSFRTGPFRPLIAALVTLTLVRSFLENGLIESSVTFVLFFTLALLLDPATRNLTERPERRDFRVPELSGTMASQKLATLSEPGEISTGPRYARYN